jgi:serine/threonine protein kinase
MPDSLSSDCQGLLRRLLHPDPAQRIKMEGVLRHPWFLTGECKEYHKAPHSAASHSNFHPWFLTGACKKKFES